MLLSLFGLFRLCLVKTMELTVQRQCAHILTQLFFHSVVAVISCISSSHFTSTQPTVLLFLPLKRLCSLHSSMTAKLWFLRIHLLHTSVLNPHLCFEGLVKLYQQALKDTHVDLTVESAGKKGFTSLKQAQWCKLIGPLYSLQSDYLHPEIHVWFLRFTLQGSNWQLQSSRRTGFANYFWMCCGSPRDTVSGCVFNVLFHLMGVLFLMKCSGHFYSYSSCS